AEIEVRRLLAQARERMRVLDAASEQAAEVDLSAAHALLNRQAGFNATWAARMVPVVGTCENELQTHREIRETLERIHRHIQDKQYRSAVDGLELLARA